MAALRTLRKAADYEVSPLLCEIVFSHVGMRRVKLLGELHADVCDDYGSITARNVRRACAYLLDQRKIAAITDPRSGDTRGYVRYNSPLLWEQGGYLILRESLEDAIQAAG